MSSKDCCFFLLDKTSETGWNALDMVSLSFGNLEMSELPKYGVMMRRILAQKRNFTILNVIKELCL